MCWCRPEIRTPDCGRPECHPPGKPKPSPAPPEPPRAEMPEIQVGDVVEHKIGNEVVRQRLHTAFGAQSWHTTLRPRLLAVYRPIWRKEP